MKLSVIVPVYNGDRYLRRCVDSILNSILDDIEVILVDDGSTDNSWNIMQEYEKTDNRVVLVQRENGGLSCARNSGINVATGDFITFVDADDYVTPDLYYQCKEVIKANNPDLIHFRYYVAFGDGQNYEVNNNIIAKDVLHDRKYVEEYIIPVLISTDNRKNEYFIDPFAWNKVFKREILENYSIRFDEGRRKWEDQLFVASYLRYVQSFYSMSACGYYYLMSGGNTLSGRFDAQILEIILENYRLYRQYYGEMYSFENDYTNRYFCDALIKNLAEQFAHVEMEDEIVAESMIKRMLDNETAQKLFSKYKPVFVKYEVQQKAAKNPTLVSAAYV